MWFNPKLSVQSIRMQHGWCPDAVWVMPGCNMGDALWHFTFPLLQIKLENIRCKMFHSVFTSIIHCPMYIVMFKIKNIYMHYTSNDVLNDNKMSWNSFICVLSFVFSRTNPPYTLYNVMSNDALLVLILIITHS